MLGNRLQRFLITLGLSAIAIAFLYGCSGSSQISGIVAIAKMETVACQPKQKAFQIRNDNTSEPQRVQGVHFELGTNNDKHFKILDVVANGQQKMAVGNLVEEIILTPGGTMTVNVEYNPKDVTTDEPHTTYLDIVLNGPKLGIMQIEIQGQAPTALEGCLGSGDVREFQVTGVKTYMSHTDLGEHVTTDLDVGTDVTGTFKLSMDGDQATLKTDGWPIITFPLPPNSSGLDELDIVLEEDTVPADFSGSSLTFEDVTFKAGGIIIVSGLTLTTGSITIDSSEAPNVFGGSITLTGSELNSSGEMTLVVAAPLNEPPVDTVEKVGGGVFGLELSLKRIQ